MAATMSITNDQDDYCWTGQQEKQDITKHMPFSDLPLINADLLSSPSIFPIFRLCISYRVAAGSRTFQQVQVSHVANNSGAGLSALTIIQPIL